MSGFDWKRNDLCLVVGDGIRDIAIEPTVDDGACLWYVVDGHRRMMLIERVLEDRRERFKFRDTHGRAFTLERMTIARYNAMRTRGARKITTLTELRRMVGLAA